MPGGSQTFGGWVLSRSNGRAGGGGNTGGGGEGASKASTVMGDAATASTVTLSAEERVTRSESAAGLSKMVARSAASTDGMTMLTAIWTLAAVTVSDMSSELTPSWEARLALNPCSSKEDTSPASVKSAATTGRYEPPGLAGGLEGGGRVGGDGGGVGDGDGAVPGGKGGMGGGLGGGLG